MRTEPDHLTIAYIAMGALEAIRTCQGGALPSSICDDYSGQLGFINACIDNALMLDRMADEAGEGGLAGVFVYEVAEPFGEQYARALIEGRDENAEAIAARLFKDMQGDSAS